MKEKDGPMEDGNGGQVGGTGGEGCVVPSSWRHLQDSDKNANIGGANNHQVACFVKCDREENDLLTNVGVRAGNSNYDCVLTDKVIYDIISSKGQFR